MLKNYIKIGLRNLRKNKIFTLINITGLSVSVTFCVLLFLHIRQEQSFDKFHSKKDRLYRLEMTDFWAQAKDKPKPHFFSFLTKDDDTKNVLVFPLVVATDMKNAFPEIEHIIPIKNEGPVFVKIGEQLFKERNILFAGEQFFTSLSFPLITGSSQTALSGRNNIVLSETMARKYFGSANPVGKTIEFTGEDSALYIVSAVAKDAPDNSSFQFDLILPITASSGYEENIKERFNHMTHPMIVELKEGVSAQQFEAKMNKWVKGYFFEPYFSEYDKNNKDIDESKMNWMLRPLADSHYNISSPWGHYTNAKNIYQLSCLVIIILVIASLNYILLAVSSGASRSQEIGVRKVMGASRRSVIFQFWTETQLVVVMAIFIGLLLAQILLPFFNRLIDSNLSIKDFYLPQTALALVCLGIALGLLAGYYPALFISRIKPVSILKSFQTFRVNPRFSKLLVVIQYSVCIILMMAAFVITRQMRYISNKDLGFDKDQVVLVENQTYDREQTKTIRERLAVFAQSEPSIIQYAAMTGGLDGAGNRNGFKLNGEQQWLRQLDVDYNYFKLLGIDFVRGRPFSPSILSDTSSIQRPCVVNETLFKLLGSNAKLGEYNEAIRSTIIGVVKDYHIETLSKKIEPEQHMLIRGYIRYFMFKVKPGDMQQSIAKIQQAWKESSGGIPFEYTFLDQTIARMYEGEVRWQNIIQASCFFAIIIACMGLFGLSAINTTNRIKEIGIRKVLGASVREVVSSLSFRFIIMVLIAFVIAIPASWWMMNKWLEDFEYRITITWWMYVLVGVAAMLIALLTVGYQSVKAAVANPVDSLRTE